MQKVQVDSQDSILLQRGRDAQRRGQNDKAVGKAERKIHLQHPLSNMLIFVLAIVIVFVISAVWFRSNAQQARNMLSQKPTVLRPQVQKKVCQIQLQNKDLYPVVNHPPQAEHKHPISPLLYASLGVPHVGGIFNYTKVCLSNFKDYQKELYEFFRPYNDTDCEYAIYGSQGNGNESYVLCKNFISTSSALVNIGQDGKDSFGCSISAQFNIPNYLYECRKHSYFEETCPNNHGLTKFARKCFGDELEKIEDYDFTLINKEIDLERLTDKNIILKLNAGGNQWAALRNVPLEYLQKIDQLILVVYLPHQQLRNTVYWGNLDIINSLRQSFVSVYVHLNNMYRIKIAEMKEMQRKYSCAVFYVTLVNKKLIKLNSDSRSYNQKIPSYKNNPNDDYLQIIEQQ